MGIKVGVLQLGLDKIQSRGFRMPLDLLLPVAFILALR